MDNAPLVAVAADEIGREASGSPPAARDLVTDGDRVAAEKGLFARYSARSQR
jgi:hypothetical protein